MVDVSRQFTPQPLYFRLHWIGSKVGPVAGLDSFGQDKLSYLPGIEKHFSVFQPIALSLYSLR